jgi:hypothetical protein
MLSNVSREGTASHLTGAKRILRLEKRRAERITSDDGPAVPPFMDFGMTIRESETAGGPVVTGGCIHENVVHHVHRKGSVIDATIVLVEQNPEVAELPYCCTSGGCLGWFPARRLPIVGTATADDETTLCA